MKHILLSLFCAAAVTASAQTDVTKKYIDNADFGSRFAAWDNAGSFTYNTDNTFEKMSGEVWMEKWVASGGKLGTNAGMKQRLVDMPAGTYTLTVAAQNIQQSNKTKTQTGAFVYAGDAQTEIGAADDYSVRFTLLTGSTMAGVKLTSCTGNWVCIDNFRLTYEGFITAEADAAMQKLIDEAEGIIEAGDLQEAELRAAIDAAKAAKGGADASAAQEVAKALQRATLNYRVENATGVAPKVTTNAYVATGTTIALGRATISGSNIMERGFCWSEDDIPTVCDERSTRTFENNGTIYVMDKLKPATMYYVRAYAMTKSYQVTYGDMVRIATLPYGKVTCDYDNAGDEQQNRRIHSAILECIWLYNNLCHIENKNISVHYVENCGSNGQTADCNINGWMRVSYNTPYQQTGTMLHETNHGVGVGTTDSWYNNPNLRASVSRGDWLGPRATQMVRFFDNNNTSVLTGDGTHMWPYGINGAHEDAYNPENTCLYFANALVTHALHQDGLQTSWGAAPVPAYVFTQNDYKNYYIKCEEATCGAQTAYLTMTATGALRTEVCSGADALKDDNFAWNITYDPATSLYIFRNVGTGKYLSYATNIKGVVKAVPTATEKFHIMPSREDVKWGNFSATSYWIMHDTSHALKGGTLATGKTAANAATVAWDAANTATDQRWVFVEEDDVEAVDAEAVKTASDELKALIANVNKMLATPYHANDEAATAESCAAPLLAAVDAAEAVMAEGTSATAISESMAKLNEEVLAFLALVSPSDMAQPFDLSFFLINASLDGGCTGWSTNATFNYSLCEFYQSSFDFNQTTTQKMPIGTYEMRVQAFQRPGAWETTYNDYVVGGKNNCDAKAYIKTKSVAIKNIWDDANTRSLGGTTKSKAGKYIPDNMQAASMWFAKEYYDNSVMVNTTIPATIKVGVRGTKADDGFWTCFDNFRLYYYGAYSIEDVTAVEAPRTQSAAKADAIYDLSGRKVTAPSRGLYIVNGKVTLF